MKAQARSVENKETSINAGTPQSQEVNFPHAGTTLSNQPSISYPSMIAEVNKIADAVSFEGIKRFFGLK